MTVLYKDIYVARSDSLRAVINGTSINRAAQYFRVNRTTLTNVCKLAVQLHPDGRPWGFRACVPFVQKHKPLAADASLPQASAPHAFAKVLANFPHLKLLADNFKGPLPSRGSRSPAFDRLYKAIKKTLKDAGLEHLYPLNTQTQGRRPLIAYIRDRRSVVLEAGGGSGMDAAPSLNRMDQIVQVMPLERVQFDAHRIDTKSSMLVHTAKGEVVSRPAGEIWLLILIDEATRVILAWMLDYGPSYKRFAVLRLLAKALTRWRPRSLIVPNMSYRPDAWMPSAVGDDGIVVRSLTTAMDNAKAHHARLFMENAHACQLGVVNAGPAHVPQNRPHVEAFFKTAEDVLLRHLAGGFKPAKSYGEKPKAVSTKKAEEHPIDPEALEDLMDVFITNYHSTPHSDLQGRSPRQAFESYHENAGWHFASSCTAKDVERITEIRTYVTIRGYRRDGKPPEVRWKGARYRSSLLLKRWDLVGARYPAVIRFEEARKMRLMNPKTGELFVTLDALPPWHAVRHTVEDRERAIIFLNKVGLLNEELSDAIDAYHEHTRQRVIDRKLTANHYVQAGVGPAAAKPNTHKPAAQEPSTYTPSTGWVSFRPKRRSE
jgi:hypothetical protein